MGQTALPKMTNGHKREFDKAEWTNSQWRKRRKIRLLTSDPRDDFRGWVHFIASAPGRQKP